MGVTSDRRLQVLRAAISLALIACNPGDSEAYAVARETCGAVANADADPSQVMLQGFKQAEAAGVGESQFRDALVDECGMEPPPRSTLERLHDQADTEP